MLYSYISLNKTSLLWGLGGNWKMLPPSLYLFKLLLILQSRLALDMKCSRHAPVQLEMLLAWPKFTLTKPIHLILMWMGFKVHYNFWERLKLSKILMDLKAHPHQNYNSRLLLRTCHSRDATHMPHHFTNWQKNAVIMLWSLSVKRLMWEKSTRVVCGDFFERVNSLITLSFLQNFDTKNSL